ncbi:hypothetical protein JCM19239_7721 [Vibrio variabilis]|uniref:Uncharacterized protein n=1 Tax=Vibrio variabilis TaxID=990271 RepID=A0ABQ0J4Y4_9VIBR|nr:hypothetical protein JCM19239_7721 [Vibrio variabilis]
MISVRIIVNDVDILLDLNINAPVIVFFDGTGEDLNNIVAVKMVSEVTFWTNQASVQLSEANNRHFPVQAV